MMILKADKIGFLNSLIIQKNAIQNSNALMVYRYYDAELEIERVCAYSFSPKGLSEIRTAICKKDDSGYWYMSFDEEYAPFQDKDLTNLELKR